jgi:hypothetical protein
MSRTKKAARKPKASPAAARSAEGEGGAAAAAAAAAPAAAPPPKAGGGHKRPAAPADGAGRQNTPAAPAQGKRKEAGGEGASAAAEERKPKPTEAVIQLMGAQQLCADFVGSGTSFRCSGCSAARVAANRRPALTTPLCVYALRQMP